MAKLLLLRIDTIIFIAIFGSSVCCWAIPSIGGLGGVFIRGPVSAEAFSRGGAYSASPQSMSCWWNPAILSLNKHALVCCGTGYKSLGRTEGYLGIEFPIPTRAGMGFCLAYRGDPFISGLVDDQEYPLKNMNYTALVCKTGLSYLVTRRISCGVNFLIYYQRLPSDFTQDGSIIYSSKTMLGGFDFAIRYQLNRTNTIAIVTKNILSCVRWEFTLAQEGLSPLVYDTLAAPLILGHEMVTAFWGRPLKWSSDFFLYAANGYFHPLRQFIGVINTGVQWQRWNEFSVSCGMRELTLNRDILYNRNRYLTFASVAISAGFQADISSYFKGQKTIITYGIATDKVWAGIEQQIDVVIKF